MAPLVLTADEALEAMEKGSSELRYLVQKESISVDVQAKIFHSGVYSVSMFASLFKDAEELKQVAKDDFGIDSAAGLNQRVAVAGLICAFRNASTRTEQVSKYEGEIEARRMTKPLQQSDFLVMRSAWQAKWWVLEDVECPARSYLEKRIEEMEQGEMRAESLRTVLNREQDDVDFLTPVWDPTGNVKMKKSSG